MFVSSKQFDYVVCRSLLERIMQYAVERTELHKLAMLFLAVYVFLLRLPSEGLPLVAHEGDNSLSLEGDQLVIHLRRRKNRPAGSRLVRTCWCARSKPTCPIHVLGAYVAAVPAGHKLFQGISASSALQGLRLMLRALTISRAGEYRTHDLRRGHAKDLQLSGKWRRRFLLFSVTQCLCRSAPMGNIGSRRVAIAGFPCLH